MTWRDGVLFYTGTHQPQWLGVWRVPLFVSRRRLVKYVNLPRAVAPWALDSGGFTEIAKYGRWETSPRDYVREVRRFQKGVGHMTWAAPQDWMCEPAMLEKTGLTVAEHQRRTTRSYLDLREAAPDVPWIPVVQGWEHDDYVRHVEEYRTQGVRLEDLPVVGVGSVCRRQASTEIRDIFRSLHARGLKMHGFGVKMHGLELSAQYLTSADSMAWSFGARRAPRLPECPPTHKNCANCRRYAAKWRHQVVQIKGVGKYKRTDTIPVFS